MYPKDYIRYLAHYHGDRDYFECHEILEEYWKETEPANKRSILVAFILLAVSSYHHRRENFPGAYRTIRKAEMIFKEKEGELKDYGINSIDLFQLLTNQAREIKEKKPYQSMNLPLSDPMLVEALRVYCKSCGWRFGQASDLTKEELIHRHSKRDRSEVILERNRALEKRHQNRQ